ncbi:MAG TPA: CAAX prenyl protease-related protein [Candidatus Saccharimonadia bacterium]|nr:CAAX prenyl protease-related protein [Candidatus Saccharimonadia bacterium]
MPQVSLSAIRSPAVAHVLPLALFMLLNAVPAAVGVENPDLPWWRHSPEQWVYPLQTAVIAVVLALGWRHYQFRPWRGFGLATALGAIGIVLWCLPALAWQKLSAAGHTIPEWCEWFGVAKRTDGFDPSFFQSEPFWYPAAMAMRFIRLVVIVPLVEEIFWRGFLMRYLVADGDDFRKVPFGTHTWLSFAIVTAGVVIAHNPVDYLGALIWGCLVYFVAVRTKSLAACVLMHAVANLLLGIYVVVTRQWGFW